MVFLGDHPAKMLATIYCVCSVCVFARACGCVLLCRVLIIAVHLGNNVVFYPLYHRSHHRPQCPCNATQTISSPYVPETVSPRDTNLRKTAERGANTSPFFSVADECVSHSATVNRGHSAHARRHAVQC